MKKTLPLIISTAVSFAALTFSAVADNKPMNISEKDQVVQLLNSIESGDQKPASYINPNKYIQHNLGVADGLAGFGAVLQALPKGSAKVDVKRVFQDGNYVFTHTDYNFFGPKVGFDLFKFEEGKIVEHWDNLIAKTEKPNPSNRTQLDGATKIEDLDKTEANKALVKNFVQSVLIDGKYDLLPNFISTETYLQHNPDIADGLDGLGNAIEYLAKQGIKMIFNTNHIVLGEGNFVLSVSEGTFGDKAVSYYDLFRVSEGKIVEHWDVIEPITPKAEWKNNNGKFGGLK